MPCPHCGSSTSFMNRSAKDFKPIVPKEIQKEFKEPPPPIVSAPINPPAAPKPIVPPSPSSSITSKPSQRPDTIPFSKAETNIKTSETFNKTQPQEKPIENYLNFKNKLEAMDNNIKQVLKNQEKFEEIILDLTKQLQDQHGKEK